MCAQGCLFPAALAFPSLHALCRGDITVFQLKKAQKLLLMTALQSHQCHDIPILRRGLEASDPKKKEVPSSSFHRISPGEVTTYLMWTGISFRKASCAWGCPGCRGAVELKPRQSRGRSPEAEPPSERPEDGSVGHSRGPGPEIWA